MRVTSGCCICGHGGWSETGTFLSKDPVESEPPYQYVRGNPVNRVDPSGYQTVVGEAVLGGGVALACVATAPACAAAITAGAVVIGVTATAVIIYVSVDYLVQHPEIYEVVYPARQPLPVPVPAPAQDPPQIGTPPAPPFVSADGIKPVSAVPGRDPGEIPEPEPRPAPDPLIDVLPGPTCTPERPERHISLGLSREGPDLDARPLLAPFTNLLNKEWNPRAYVYSAGRWENVVIDKPVRPFYAAFNAAMAAVKSGKIARIHFNLEGIRGISGVDQSNPYADFAEGFGSKGNITASESIFPNPPPPFITADELYIIKNDAILCNRTTFYEKGSTSLAPYTRQICGR